MFIVSNFPTTDDKKLMSALKKLGVTKLDGIEEVNIFMENNDVIHFGRPMVQAAVQSNVFVVSGNCETKPLEQLLPGILNQLGQDGVQRMLATMSNSMAGKMPAAAAAEEDDDDVPDLVENFEDASEK
jgi:nascent polypeptide-associated complex subunit beta